MSKTLDKKTHLVATVSEYAIPPLKDILVMGKDAPIGCIAMRRALELLVKQPLVHIEIADEVISDILVRQSLLKRVGLSELTHFVVEQIKPLMSSDEILQGELDVSVYLSSGL